MNMPKPLSLQLGNVFKYASLISKDKNVGGERSSSSRKEKKPPREREEDVRRAERACGLLV